MRRLVTLLRVALGSKLRKGRLRREKENLKNEKK